jgi:membrane protein YqaA with SNARE-associated domain
MKKSDSIPLLVGTSIILLGIAFTGKDNLLGALLGYWFGMVNTQWLHRDTRRSMDDDVLTAIKRMRRSYYARLGMITLVVAAVGRYQADWLFTLALGIALGLVVSLFLSVKKIANSGKG